MLAHSRLPLAWHEQRIVTRFLLQLIRIHNRRDRQPTSLAAGAANIAIRIRQPCGTGIEPDRDTTAPPHDVAGLCASLPTLPRGMVPKLVQNPGFVTNEGKIRRETDCLLEGDGFELPVPWHKNRGFPQHSGHGGGSTGLLNGTT